MLQLIVAAFYEVQEETHRLSRYSVLCRNLALHAQADDTSHKSGLRPRCSRASELTVPQKWGEIRTLSICTIGMWDSATRLLLFWNQLKAAFNRAREEYFGRTLNKINAEDDKEILIMLRTCAVVSLGFTQFASSCDLRDIIINIKKSRNVWVWRLMCIWDDCVSDSHYDQTNSLQWNPQRLILFLPGCQSDISHVLSLWVALLFSAENLIFVFPSHPFW